MRLALFHTNISERRHLHGHGLYLVGVTFNLGHFPGLHCYFFSQQLALSLWRSPSFRAHLKMTEMTSVSVLVGGIGKAMLAGGREGAAVPGRCCLAARTPLGLLSVLLVPKGRTRRIGDTKCSLDFHIFAVF